MTANRTAAGMASLMELSFLDISGDTFSSSSLKRCGCILWKEIHVSWYIFFLQFPHYSVSYAPNSSLLASQGRTHSRFTFSRLLLLLLIIVMAAKMQRSVVSSEESAILSRQVKAKSYDSLSQDSKILNMFKPPRYRTIFYDHVESCLVLSQTFSHVTIPYVNRTI